METTRQVNRSAKIPTPQGWPSNDKRHKPLSMGCSVFPDDAVARIYKPCGPRRRDFRDHETGPAGPKQIQPAAIVVCPESEPGYG